MAVRLEHRARLLAGDVVKVIGDRMHRDSGEPIDLRLSPNFSNREHKEIVAIVLHYTAGRSFEQSVAWLRNPKAKASPHFVSGEDAQVAQLVPLDRVAWHAGESEWQDGDRKLAGLNDYSIGIELDNPGMLTKTADGWRTYFGRFVPNERVVIDDHKNAPGKERGWCSYPEAQFDACYELCEALIDAFPTIRMVLGHDDIAPGRKWDPGPGFPMERLRSMLFGRGDG